MPDSTENGDQDSAATTAATTTEDTTTTDTTEDPFKFEDDGTAPTITTEEKEDKSKDDSAKGDDDSEDDDKKAFKKIIDEGVSSIKQGLDRLNSEKETTRIDTEWKQMLTDYPELKNFAPKILRYAKHDSYKGKPITQAVMDVAGINIFVKIGATRAKVADTKANDTKEGGGSTSGRETGGDDSNNGKTPSFVGMSKADIYKHVNAARQGNRK